MEKQAIFHEVEKSFKTIQEVFPNLTMNIVYTHEQLDLSMDIPKQPGLDFNINVNLQNIDEIHISTKYIHCSFFSAKSQYIVDMFYQAVQGLINGNYRIVQFHKRGKLYKSLLQCFKDNEWVTANTEFYKMSWPWTKYEKTIIQNKKY